MRRCITTLAVAMTIGPSCAARAGTNWPMFIGDGDRTPEKVGRALVEHLDFLVLVRNHEVRVLINVSESGDTVRVLIPLISLVPGGQIPVRKKLLPAEIDAAENEMRHQIQVDKPLPFDLPPLATVGVDSDTKNQFLLGAGQDRDLGIIGIPIQDFTM